MNRSSKRGASDADAPRAAAATDCGSGPSLAGAIHPARGEIDPPSIIAKHFPAMRKLREAAYPEITAIERRLSRDEARGRDMSGLRQAVRELCWRIESTADVVATGAALRRVREFAAMPAPPSALGRNDDGSFGIATDVWFFKLDASIDALLGPGGDDPRAPAVFLDRVNDPGRLKVYLDQLLISNPVEDGIDRRKELNLASANLVRLILRNRPTGYSWHPDLERVIRRFVADWQDADSGFFGAAYAIGGQIWRTNDLSLTFHMARYLDGAIAYWPQLIDTLFAIRDERYPNGWLDEDGMTNHNNYDVAALLRLGWEAMRADQRGRAADELDRLLSWCLEQAIAPDGRVAARAAGESLPESYYFAVAFLDAAGFFAAAAPFWRDRGFPQNDSVREKLRARILDLDQRNPMTRMALARLGG